MNYYLGLDGGGTKTEACLLDLDSLRELGRAVAGTINVNGADPETVRKNLAAVLADAGRIVPLRDLSGICIGTAGVSNPQEAETLRDALTSFGIAAGLVRITGDQEIALEGAFSGRDGILLISGTGSICVGKRSGRLVRSGGRGYLFDDPGSGYAIGREMLAAAVRFGDGRSDDAIPGELVRKKLSALLGEKLPAVTDEAFTRCLITYTYDRSLGKAGIAQFGALLDEAVAEGSPTARRIAKQAAEELLSLLRAVRGRLADDTAEENVLPAALLGSVLVKGEAVRACLLRKMEEVPDVRITAPEHDAAYGAALLAAHRTHKV